MSQCCSSFNKFKNPKFLKYLTLALIAVAVVMAITVITLLILYALTPAAYERCTTEKCLRSAGNLFLSANLEIDPCQDFYGYACGLWSNSHLNHRWFSSFSSATSIEERILSAANEILALNSTSRSEAFNRAKTLYKSCIDELQNDDPEFSILKDSLKEIGLPLIPIFFTKNQSEKANFEFDWLLYEARIKRMLGADVFMRFDIVPNFYMKHQYCIVIGVPENDCPLPSPPLEVHVHDSEGAVRTERQVESRIIRYTFQKFLETVDNQTNVRLLKEASDIVLTIKKKLKTLKIMYSKPWKRYDAYDIQMLDSRIKGRLAANTKQQYPFLLDTYVTYLTEGSARIRIEENFIFSNEQDVLYLPEVLSYILSTPAIHLELYLWWFAVNAMIMNTGSSVQQFFLEQRSLVVDTNAVPLRPREIECADTVVRFMHKAVAYGLAEKKEFPFANSTKRQVTILLENIKTALRKKIEWMDWMDQVTKDTALEKLRIMKHAVGEPDWLFDSGLVDDFYEDFPMQDNNFLGNLMQFVKRIFPTKLKLLMAMFYGRDSAVSALDVRVYNSLEDNTLYIPMAILTHPMYDLGLESLNYGALGTTIGHALVHTFNRLGQRFGVFERYEFWWSDEADEMFEERSQCFIKQYDGFYLTKIGIYVDGTKTLTDNIADSVALHVAFDAYMNHMYTQEAEPKLPGFEKLSEAQLFFLAFGNRLCEAETSTDLEAAIRESSTAPGAVRVLGALQNSAGFARAYGCARGTPMNPKGRKCKIW